MLEKVRDQAIEQLKQEVAQALRILVTGENSSSFAIRMITMRLLHLGCQGARIVSVTTPAESLLGQISDVVIKIAVVAPDRSGEQLRAVFFFEQSMLLLFDALFCVMTRSLNESADLPWALHTGLA